MPTLPHSRRALGWLALTCLPIACTGAGGTPTPEPPDHLPTPNIVLPVFTQERTLTNATLGPTPLVGSVRAGEDAWVVNLDRPEVAPVRVRADGEGTFTARVEGAHDGDRIRVVARTATRHSQPADLTIFGSASEPGMFKAADPTALACLTVERDELVSVVARGAAHTQFFNLINRCDQPVRLDDVRMHRGDQGMTVLAPPASIAVGSAAQVAVSFDGHDDDLERADVVLLEISSGAETGRYALGVYSVSSSSLGKD
ncbi:MAG: hypothetical protein ABW252_23395 [Polyangiales bacterium]